MLVGLVTHPVLSGRLLKMFMCDHYGPHHVLPADLAMSCDEARVYHPVAYAFIAALTVGVPVVFFRILWVWVRPLYQITNTRLDDNDFENVKLKRQRAILFRKRRPTISKTASDATVALEMQDLAVARQRMKQRFGVLFGRYNDRAWWWELVEVARKLTLVALLVFVADNTATQIFFA
eukprot:3671644-Prymnesium_polylepis.2